MFRRVQIERRPRGYVVEVGCLLIVYGDTVPEKSALLTDLREYLDNPDEKEKVFCERYSSICPPAPSPSGPHEESKQTSGVRQIYDDILRATSQASGQSR